MGLGFGVLGPGSRVEGSGFRVQGSGFRVQGVGLPEVKVVAEERVERLGVAEGLQLRPVQLQVAPARKVDIRLPGKGNSNFHGERPVHHNHLDD